MTDLNLFAGKIKARALAIRANTTYAHKKAMAAILKEVVAQTPVDTGLAISNWAIGIDRKPLSYRFYPFVPGEKGSTELANQAEAIRQGLRVISAFNGKRNQSMNLANYLPYIIRLNEGSSPQQPTPGFIERAFVKGAEAVRSVKILDVQQIDNREL